MRQDIARISRARGIDSYVTFVDVLNNAVLIDYEGGAIAIAALFIENSVIPYNCAFEVAQQWKGDPILFGKFAVGRNAVYAETENLSIRRFEFGDISLIRLHFLRSTTGKG